MICHHSILLYLYVYELCTQSPLTSVLKNKRWHEKGKTILDFNEARDDTVTVASAELYAHHVDLAADR